MDDSNWFVEDTSDTSTLKKISGKSDIQKLPIKVNLYSPNGMITVDFGKGDRRFKVQYNVPRNWIVCSIWSVLQYLWQMDWSIPLIQIFRGKN